MRDEGIGSGKVRNGGAGWLRRVDELLFIGEGFGARDLSGLVRVNYDVGGQLVGGQVRIVVSRQ